MPHDPFKALIEALAEHAYRREFIGHRGADPDQPLPVGTPNHLQERYRPPVSVEHGPRRIPRPPSSPRLPDRGKSHETFFVCGFDPDADDGKGRFLVTPNHVEALRFSSWEEASNFCKRKSPIAPNSRDGEPSRRSDTFFITIVADLPIRDQDT